MKANRNSTSKDRRPSKLKAPQLFAAYVSLLPSGDEGREDLAMTGIAVMALLLQMATRGSVKASHHLFGFYDMLDGLVRSGLIEPSKEQSALMCKESARLKRLRRIAS